MAVENMLLPCSKHVHQEKRKINLTLDTMTQMSSVHLFWPLTIGGNSEYLSIKQVATAIWATAFQDRHQAK